MKKPFYLLVSLTVLLILLVAVNIVLNWRKSRGLSQTSDSNGGLVAPYGIPQKRADLNDIQEAGRRCLGISAHTAVQSNETNLNPTVPALKKYHFHLVFRKGIGGKPCLVAASDDGGTFQMPAEFEKMIQKEGVVVVTTADALDLATTYVRTTVPLGKLLVLSDLKMIPGVDRNPPRQAIQIHISSPQVENLASDYCVRLFTWKELGGIIETWSITMHKNGTMQIQSEQLAKLVGDAVGLQ